MLDHYIQREIVYRLAHATSLRFSELKPDDIENKLFDYHLKKVIFAGFIEKNSDGQYALTPEGKRIGKGALRSPKRMIDRAYSLILIALQSDSGAWLLERRLTQPQIDKVGFLQTQPSPDLNPVQSATNFLESIGITASPVVHGHGYFSYYREQTLESFIHFTLVIDRINTPPIDLPAHYSWHDESKLTDSALLSSTPLLLEMAKGTTGTFIHHRFQLTE